MLLFPPFCLLFHSWFHMLAAVKENFLTCLKALEEGGQVVGIGLGTGRSSLGETEIAKL